MSFQDNQIRCSFSIYSSDSCGLYQRFPNEEQCVRLYDCKKDILPHKRLLNLSVGSKERGFKIGNDDVLCEADLLCRRVGLFDTNLFLTVCPLHRAKLGIAFKQGKLCLHPQHTGKGKTFRGVSSQQSRHILQDHGVLVPIGSGICYQCYNRVNQLILPMEVCTDEGGKTETATFPSHNSEQMEAYSLRERRPIHESEINLESQLSASSQSDNLSQISTWSDELDTSFSDINASIQTISKGSISPLKFQLRTDYDLLKDSSKRIVKRKATTVVHAVLSCIAPGQERKLLKLIQPAETDDEETKCLDQSELVQLIIKLFKESSNAHTKRQLLSMISGKYTKKELQNMIPGLTTYYIDQARLHASEYGEGVAVPKQDHFFRQRLDQDKLAHALDFFFSPTFNQVCSFGTKEMKLQSSGEVIQVPDIVRTVCHATLINTYTAFCKESDYQSLSPSTLYKVLQSCPASKRTNLKGLDNIAADGAAAFEFLSKIVSDLQSHIIEENEKLKKIGQQVHTSKVYLKTDFKLHVQIEDPCADHCIKYALSDGNSPHLQDQCQHSCHSVVCDRCSLFPNAVLQLKQILAHERITDLTEEKTTEVLSDIEMAENNIARWKEHIVRSINQDKGRTEILNNLKEEEALIVMDWAMKFLPMAFREKQSEWYGQKGTNWHVSVAIFKDNLNDLKHRTYAHIFESVKQDWFAVASVLENLLSTLKKQLPKIKTVFLRSDNAGCYHCGNLWLALHGISERTGINIARYDFSESQCGKSYCDAKIAHMRGRIRQYVANGNNVRNATEMKAAIDSFGGIVGCQAAHAEINLQNQNSYIHTWKGITKINNLSFNQDGSIRTWKAYDIGIGNLLSKEEVIKMCSVPQGETGLTVIADFKEPATVEGNVAAKPASNDCNQVSDELEPNSENSIIENYQGVLHCPEDGCTKVFLTFKGLESHILTEKHKFILNSMSTFDEIRLKWKACCDSMSENVAVARNTAENSMADIAGKQILQLGWALSRDRKVNRFSDKVKTFMRGIFEAGELGCKKVNAMEVANHMRVCLDEEGNKMFKPSEYLQQGQIASFFSRLAVMAKVPPKKRQTIDDSDLESVIAHLNSVEAIEIVNRDF